jgi:hypothetical protein
MKKFGTPIGAGPGRANEKVGLDGVGTPLLVTGGGGVGGLARFFLFFFFFFCFGLGFGAAGWVTFLPASEVPGLSFVGLCPLPWPATVVEVWMVVVGVELLDVDEEEPGEVFFGLGFEVVEVVVLEGGVEVGAVAVTVSAGVVAVAGGQDWETLVIAAPGGSGSELGGVPGATFWKMSV